MAVMLTYAQVLAVGVDRVKMLVIDIDQMRRPVDRVFPASPVLAFMLLVNTLGDLDLDGMNAHHLPKGRGRKPAAIWDVFRNSPDFADMGVNEFGPGPDDNHETWYVANAKRVVRSVAAREQRRVRVRSQLSFAGPQPEAIYTIRVTDPAWVRHLRVGTEWESTAYRPEGTDEE